MREKGRAGQHVWFEIEVSGRLYAKVRFDSLSEATYISIASLNIERIMPAYALLSVDAAVPLLIDGVF